MQSRLCNAAVAGNVFHKPWHERLAYGVEAFQILGNLPHGEIQVHDISPVSCNNLVKRALRRAKRHVRNIFEHGMHFSAELGCDVRFAGQTNDLALGKRCTISAPWLIRHERIELRDRKPAHVLLRAQQRGKLGRIKLIARTPIAFDGRIQALGLRRHVVGRHLADKLLQRLTCSTEQQQMTPSPGQGDEQQAARIVFVLRIADQQVVRIQSTACCAFMPRAVIGIRQVHAIKLQTLRAMRAGQAHSAGLSQAQARIDGDLIPLGGIKTVDHIRQAKRSPATTRDIQLTLGKAQQRAHADVELRGCQRIHFVQATIIRQGLCRDFEQKLANRCARSLRRPPHQIVMQTLDARIRRFPHRAQPVPVMLPPRPQCEGHRRFMTAAELRCGHNLRQIAIAQLLAPLRQRRNASNAGKHHLHAFSREHILRLLVREGDILRNQIRDKSPQRRMLRRDHGNRLVSVSARFRIAGVHAFADAARDRPIFLRLRLIDRFGKHQLVALRPIRNDLLAFASAQTSFNLARNLLSQVNDSRRGSIVRTQNNVARLVAISELVDALDGCTLKTHDGLVIIADGHNVGLLQTLAQKLDDAHLSAIGVLEFVDLDVSVTVLQGLTEGRVFFDGVHEIEDHIVVIVQPLFIEHRLVLSSNLTRRRQLLALLAHLEEAAILVRAIEELVANLAETRRFALLIDKFGSHHRIVELLDERNIHARRRDDRTFELARSLGIGAEHLFFELFCNRNACSLRRQIAQRGIPLQPIGGLLVLLRNRSQLLIRYAAAFHLRNKCDHFTRIPGRSLVNAGKRLTKRTPLKQPVHDLHLMQSRNQLVGSRSRKRIQIQRARSIREPMERAYLNTVRITPHQLDKALAHGFGTGFGIRQAQDIAWRNIALRQYVGGAQA